MQVIYTGSESIQGKKKDGGAPYGPFYKLHYLAPHEGVNTENRQVGGGGFIPKEISVTAEVFQQALACKPLTKVEITASPDPQNINRTVVTGVVQA